MNNRSEQIEKRTHTPARQQEIPHKGRPSGPVEKRNLKKSVVDVKTPRRDANKTTYPDKRPRRRTARRRGNVCPRHSKETPQEPAGDNVKNAELPGECKALQDVITPSENKDGREPPVKTTPSVLAPSEEKTQKIAGDLEKNSEQHSQDKQPQKISPLSQSIEGKETSVQTRRSNIRQSRGKKKKTAGKLEKNPEQHRESKHLQELTPLDQSNDGKESPVETVCFTLDQLKEDAQESAGDLAKNPEQAAVGKALQDVSISSRSKDCNRPPFNLMIETGPETENVNTTGVRNQEDLPDHSDSQSEGQTDAPSAASAAAAAGTISQTIPITVMLPNNEPLNISFAPDRTVRELEDRIKSLDKIANGICIFTYSGRTLDPSKTLEDYKVQKNATIYLREPPKTFPVPSEDAKEAGPEVLNAGFQTVSVVLPDRSRVVVNVEPGMTVGDLNRKLAQQQGVPPSSQCLIYSGRQMEDHRLFKEYQVPENSVIFVHQPQSSSVVQNEECATSMLPVEVVINETGNRMRLPINPRGPNSMRELSKQIEVATRIPAKEQELIYRGKVLGEGENLLLLRKEFMQEPVVAVRRRVHDEIQIFLQNIYCQTKVVRSSSNSTVRQLKEKVRELESVEVRDQMLIYQGRILEDRFTLKQSKVVNGSTVRLMPRQNGGSTTWLNE
ncbi:hypothetical protein SprV_0401726300 [Sparganum proliferum]